MLPMCYMWLYSDHGDRHSRAEGQLEPVYSASRSGTTDCRVTAHGRVVAELVPPESDTRKFPGSRWDELIAAGILHPPVETGDQFEDWPNIRLPPELLGEPPSLVTIVTRDGRVRENAEALGYAVE